MKKLGTIIAFGGAFLFLATAAGQWTPMGNYESVPPRGWEDFEPSLARELDSFSRLVEFTQDQISPSLSEREVMNILYDTVSKRFTHNQATHNLFSNWILYFSGMIHPAFSHIYDPNLLVRKGHSLLCDQASYVLLRLALEHGIRARHVGLDGHVVMEAWYDSDWHLYDPDLEVVPLNSDGQVLSVEKLAQDQVLLEKYYGPHGAVDIISSRENNTYMSYPEGARFEWKTNVLVYFERCMELMKFLLPVTLIVIGSWIDLRLTKRDA